MKQLVFLVILLSMTIPGWAQKSRFKVYKEDSQNRAEIRNNRPVSVFYEKLSWNQQPIEIETGYMYLRDRRTNSITELVLTETTPNSGVFNVAFPIGVLKQDRIEAEIYSAPQTMLKGQQGDRIDLIKNLISDGSIKRKPFLLRVLREKGQLVDIFDSKEKALEAYNRYREEMGLSPEGVESESIIEVANQQKVEKKKVIDTSTLQSLFLANENDIAATNEKDQELREVLRNLELKRRTEVKAQGKYWTLPLKNKKSKQATNLVKDAVKDMKASQFEASMQKFLKASDLAPDKEDVYEQYGISLYRDKKYNQAIVVLDISKPSENRVPEKHFYMGSSYFELKDYAKAVEHFDKVLASGNKSFGPTAAFYKGSALIEMGEFEKAKQSFQFVLDNSTDAKMDKQAEKYIEYALEREQIEKKRAAWFFLDGTLGFMYDSNIILADAQVLGASDITNESGFRFLTQINPRFRPYYSEANELNIDIDITNLKSVDESFGYNATAETADATVLTAGVPWTHRGTFGGKGYFFDLSPSFEKIIMDLDGSGSATISDTFKLEMNNTLVVNRNWIAKGNYNMYFSDGNILGDEESADATGGGIELTSIFILNKDLERYLIPSFGYRLNNAEGSNYAYTRMDLNVTYTSATFWGMMWNAKLGYYLANYESTRTDNNWTAATGVSRRINSHWNWGLTGQYIINDSTTNRYEKYNFLTTFGFNY